MDRVLLIIIIVREGRGGTRGRFTNLFNKKNLINLQEIQIKRLIRASNGK